MIFVFSYGKWDFLMLRSYWGCCFFLVEVWGMVVFWFFIKEVRVWGREERWWGFLEFRREGFGYSVMGWYLWFGFEFKFSFWSFVVVWEGFEKGGREAGGYEIVLRWCVFCREGGVERIELKGSVGWDVSNYVG